VKIETGVRIEVSYRWPPSVSANAETQEKAVHHYSNWDRHRDVKGIAIF
jgi:hypothetical protein